VRKDRALSGTVHGGGRTSIQKIIKIIFISTNMTPIRAALNSLKLLKPKETPNYTEISKKHGCDRNTLSRRRRSVRGAMAQKLKNK
jgi:uncharacterized protein YerC